MGICRTQSNPGQGAGYTRWGWAAVTSSDALADLGSSAFPVQTQENGYFAQDELNVK